MRKNGPAVEGRNGKRKIGLLSAVLLAAVLIVATVQLSVADPLNLVGGGCSLIIDPYGELTEFSKDLPAEDVKISLYKVAMAEKTEGYDSYDYILESDFNDTTLAEQLAPENLPQLDTDDWAKLAERAAEIVAANGVEPYRTVSGEEKTEKLDAGLYLMLAGGGTPILTDRYAYTFAPQFVSLPGKDVYGDAGANTANPGDWLYDMEVVLKPTREDRLGALEITKTLTLLEGQSGLSEPQTFIFSVKAVLDGETVYDNVIGMNFTGAGDQTERIEGIPATAVVTVTEIYSGSSCTIVGSDTADGVIVADEILGLTFENTEGNRNRGGHGIINSFEYDSKDGWQHEADRKQPSKAE